MLLTSFFSFFTGLRSRLRSSAIGGNSTPRTARRLPIPTGEVDLTRRRNGRPSLVRFRLCLALSGGFLRVVCYVDPLRVRRGLGLVVVVPVPPLVRWGLRVTLW